ncbi:hypothetical protein HJC23_003374 [Cyclotella cryptica]|uniref:HNH nuclease domain-containing protein n=1 Tax=Cyclotella cryptica TaxID=29204 RepID=A0ABD3R006_9STRA|eukprot:CCRYP_000952-RA/>CCRYP_000952-RA protein AED:0.02 eAED:0.02 QI:135/1/1/1/1/1/2/196/570
MNLPNVPSGPPGAPQNNHKADAPPLGELSKSRRDALKRHNQEVPIPLSNLTPITKYYSAADKVLEQFKKHLEVGELDDAYIIGRRFALFSTASLPNHHYYTSPNHAQLRIKNQRDAEWVTRGLERIVQVMDRQELQRQREEEDKRRQREEEERRKALEWQKKTRERLLAVRSARLGDLDSDDSALDMDSKLAKLNALFPKDGNHHALQVDNHQEVEIFDNTQLPLPQPVAPPLVEGTMNDQDFALFYSTSAMQQLKSNGATPMFVNEELPNYSDLFLDSLKTPSSPSLEDRFTSLPTAPSLPSRTPVRELRRKYSDEFESLLSLKTIEIIKLATYQGRLSSTPRYDSTNGCTVISPLIVATHIYPQHQHNIINSFHKQATYKRGISNMDINEIIDKRAPPILQTVRAKLGLDQHALIIPSDVHDYLVDEQILPQEKFVGVCGGNILNPGHWKTLMDMLLNGKEGDEKIDPRKQKIGAALFFRDHVVSIIKIPLGNGASYFDLIDSLPTPMAGGMASRTRCKDQSSLETLLQWYACSKFSDAHCDFIDANEWNDGMCDFDPRVFQGFIWAE